MVAAMKFTYPGRRKEEPFSRGGRLSQEAAEAPRSAREERGPRLRLCFSGSGFVIATGPPAAASGSAPTPAPSSSAITTLRKGELFCSGARVGFVIHFTNFTLGNLGIDLGGRDIGVA